MLGSSASVMRTGSPGYWATTLRRRREDVVHLRVVVGVLVLDVAVAVGVVSGQVGVVVEVGVFEEARDGVDAEAVDALVHPEAEDVGHGFLDLRIAPVEVGLLLVEVVVVPLTGLLVVGPGGVAEPGLPVVGRAGQDAFAVAPDVPVALGIGARRARLDEPRVLVGGVVDDVVHDDADAALLGLGDHAVEVGHGAVFGIDGGVVGDVVAVVDAGRGIHGRDPDGVDAEVVEVVEARGDAVDVADAVAVGVLESCAGRFRR